jgi:SSS family solute:Na+ symporter
MTANLAHIDYLVILAYLAGTLAIGLWLSRRISTEADYFLAGRRLPWWAVGMSLVASDIGGTDIIGAGGAAYSHGLAVGNFEWIGCVPAMILAAFVFIPFFWRTGIYTIPEYMERRYNAGVRSALALCWLAFMACNLGVMLYASAKFMNELTAWQMAPCIVLTAVLVGIYTISGGLAAVVYTDVLQCIVMIGGCLAVVVIGLGDLGGVGNLLGLVQEKHPEHTRLVLPVDTGTPFPWTGIFFGLALILSPAYWIGNQAIVQRSLGARSEFEAKASYVWGALLKNVIPIIIAVPGLIALVKYPGLEDGDKAVPRLVATVLPAGLRGVFVAAFLAALMSSVDSYLNSAATILTHDLYKRFLKPAADERHLLIVGRLTTLALVAWAILFAFLLMGVREGIYTIFQTLMSFFQGPALAILLLGLFWRRATGSGALAGFGVGVLCAVGLFVLSQETVVEALGIRPLFRIGQPYLYFSIWAFLATVGVVVVVSLLTSPEPEEKVKHLIFARPAEEAAGP